MATATATEPLASSVSTSDEPFDLTVDLFSRMVELGLIPRERRVYLENGRLYEKMAKSKPHGYVGAALDRALNRRLPEDWCVWPESTVVLDPRTAPLPDFSVIRGANPLEFGDRYPDPRDIGLLVEIAVSSLRKDLGPALEKYARAGIPAYWVMDVPGRRILTFSEPRIEDGGGIYSRAETYQAGQSLPLILDGQEVAMIPFDELLR